MTFARIMLPLVCSVPVLLGCTTPANAPQKDAAALTVQPLLRIGHSSSSAQDFYQLGRYYQGQNRLELAAQAYRKALEIHKDYIEAHNALGTVYSSQGKLNEAIAEFESILKSAPQLAHLYNNLGYTYYLQNNFGNAITAYEKAIALDPRNPRTYNNLGAAYLKIGDAEKSRLAYSRATDLRQNDAIANAPSSPPAVAADDAAVSTSIYLKNDAPSIDLRPELASISLETPPESTALATTLDPGITLTPMPAAESLPESITLSPARMPADFPAAEPRQSDAIASGPSAPLAAPTGEGVASTSVDLKNDAPSIDPQPLLAAISPEASPAVTALATAIDLGVTLIPMPAVESSPESPTLSPVSMPADFPATELRQTDAIASSPSAPLAASVAEGVASTSIEPKNDAPSIEPQSQLAGISLEVRPEATTPLATTVDPGMTLTPMSAMESAPESLALSPVGMSADQNDMLAFSSAVYRQDIGEIAFGLFPSLSVPAQLIYPTFKNESALAVPEVSGSVAREDKTFRLEIANGNGVTGMARKVNGTLVQQGLPASHLINLKPYRTMETTIQYRSGFRDEALRLSQKMTRTARLVSNDHLRNTADVRLVLGKDATSMMALFRTDIGTEKLAKKIVTRDDES